MAEFRWRVEVVKTLGVDPSSPGSSAADAFVLNGC